VNPSPLCGSCSTGNRYQFSVTPGLDDKRREISALSAIVKLN
jgi:hypothetical protein